MKIDVNSNVKIELILGRQGENGVRQIEFDVGLWRRYYGNGALAGVLLRDGDTNPYPVTIVNNVWTISASDTAQSGHGQLQLSWIVDDIIKKSVIYKTYVLPSLNASTVDPPDPYETYLDDIVAAGAAISLDRQAIEQLAPEIFDDADYVRSAVDDIHADAESASAAKTDAEAAQERTLSYVNTARTYANTASSASQTAREKATEASNSAYVAVRNAQNADESAASAKADAERIAKILDSISYTENGSGNIIISMGG